MRTPRCLFMLLVSAMFGLADQAGAQPPSAPVIQNVTLRQDTGVITIAGSGFDRELAITVDGQPAAVLPGGTDTQIEVLAPPSVLQTPGTYRLTVIDHLHKVGDAFVVANQAATTGLSSSAFTGTPTAEAATNSPARPGVSGALAPAAGRPGPEGVSPAAIQENSCVTSIGNFALNSSAGCYNTAAGYAALSVNTAGDHNTATGDLALAHNTTGDGNTASGATALYANTTGNFNVATGTLSLASNTTGFNNTADGVESLLNNTTGSQNTAVGQWALLANSTGSLNTAVGYRAGAAATTGWSNIFIGSGVAGTAADANTIRIGFPYDGTNGQNKTFIAGIRGTQLTGSAVQVFIDANGQLGTVTPGVQSGTGTASVSQLQQQLQDQQTTIADLRARLTKLEALLARAPAKK